VSSDELQDDRTVSTALQLDGHNKYLMVMKSSFELLDDQRLYGKESPEVGTHRSSIDNKQR
jgi:hypothetical protein